MLFCKRDQQLLKFWKHFSFSCILRQEPTDRQEGLFEARLPSWPTDLSTKFDCSGTLSLLFLLVALSGLMKKGSFHLNPTPYTKASPKPAGNLQTAGGEGQDVSGPPEKAWMRNESQGGLISSSNCRLTQGMDEGPPSLQSWWGGMGTGPRLSSQCFFRPGSGLPERDGITRAQMGLASQS